LCLPTFKILDIKIYNESIALISFKYGNIILRIEKIYFGILYWYLMYFYLFNSRTYIFVLKIIIIIIKILTSNHFYY